MILPSLNINYLSKALFKIIFLEYFPNVLKTFLVYSVYNVYLYIRNITTIFTISKYVNSKLRG